MTHFLQRETSSRFFLKFFDEIFEQQAGTAQIIITARTNHDASECCCDLLLYKKIVLKFKKLIRR